MEQFGPLFWFALGVTGKAYGWVILGILARRVGLLPDALVREASQLAFRAGLPMVLFFGAVQVDYRLVFASSYLLAAVIATLVLVFAATGYARLRRYAAEPAAIFVQAAYRSEVAVVGVALCAAAYGEEGLALAAPPVAILVILYNIIAVLVLGRVYPVNESPWQLPAAVLRNPLIIGIGLGAIYASSGLPLNFHIGRAGSIFASGMLPLALICAGASLDPSSLRGSGWFTLEASLWKLLVTPLVGLLVAIPMGIHGAELAVLFLLQASPVAAASYIMVMAAGGHHGLAAKLVLVSMLCSLLTVTLGLALLQAMGWV